MTMKSTQVDATVALAGGLVDEIVKDPKVLVQAAGKLALEIAAGKKPKRQSCDKNKIGSLEDGTRAILLAQAEASKKSKHLPHPFAFLRCVEEGLKNGFAAGIKKEREEIVELMMGTTAKALVHFFLASKATTKVPGVDVKGKKIQTIGMYVHHIISFSVCSVSSDSFLYLLSFSLPFSPVSLGGGTMGSGIAISFLMKGYNVILKEVNESLLQAAVERTVNTVLDGLKKRRLPVLAIEQIMRPFTPTVCFTSFLSSGPISFCCSILVFFFCWHRPLSMISVNAMSSLKPLLKISN
jgi:3-hydroxyacyl-CoA dehydrogenase